MDPISIEIYTSTLKTLIESLRRDPPEVHNQTWLDNYHWAEIRPVSEKIAIFLALIHPEFYKNRQGANISLDLQPPHPSQRRPIPEDNRIYKCQINILLPTAVCPYQNISGQKVLDHLWPYSLGGPSVIANRLELCARCNAQKSASYALYPIENDIPFWLSDRITQLYEIKG